MDHQSRLRRRPKWSEEEDAYLLAHYGRDLSVMEIAEHLHRCRQGISGRLKYLGVRATRAWFTDEEDEYIREHWHTQSIDDISAHLNRRHSVVAHRARTILHVPPKTTVPALKSNSRKYPVRDTEKRYIAEHWSTQSASEIGRVLNRPVNTITRHAAKLGLPRKGGSE